MHSHLQELEGRNAVTVAENDALKKKLAELEKST